MKNTYSKKMRIPSFYMDNVKTLSVPACMGIIQDITNCHSELMGVDRWSMLKSSNAFWVLTKVKLEINRMPELDEMVKIETWTIDHSAVKFERDCRIWKGKEPLVNIRSEWVTLDGTTRKIRTARSLKFPNMKNRADRSTEQSFNNLKYEISEDDFCYSRTIYSTDIDVNQHVNNCYYARFVLDAFKVSELTSKKLSGFEIHFVNEAFEGEKLDFYKKEIDGGYFVEAKNAEKVIVRAFLSFK